MQQIKLTKTQWQLIRHAIAQQHPASVLLIRPRMREVLGFTTREQGDFVVLDFYEESKKSWFVLQYL